MLPLASARLCGYPGDRHIALAAAVEFIHTATLLHDDVGDASDLRRGLATANAVWGNKPSVLVGDFLFSRAFQLMVEDGSLEVLAILSNASAVLAERPRTEQEALDAYGLNLGIAFQLIDDLLDYSARQAELGKTVGDDFREGKITLPIVLAFGRGSDEERRFWRRTLEDLQQQEGDLERAIDLLRSHGALAETLERARTYGAAARTALAPFRDCPEKRALDEVIDFCLERGF